MRSMDMDGTLKASRRLPTIPRWGRRSRRCPRKIGGGHDPSLLISYNDHLVQSLWALGPRDESRTQRLARRLALPGRFVLSAGTSTFYTWDSPSPTSYWLLAPREIQLELHNTSKELLHYSFTPDARPSSMYNTAQNRLRSIFNLTSP